MWPGSGRLTRIRLHARNRLTSVRLRLNDSRPALQTHLPAPGQAEESGEDDSEEEDEEDDDVWRRRGIHLNLIIQNLVRQNALIRTDHISQCHVDSLACLSCFM